MNELCETRPIILSPNELHSLNQDVSQDFIFPKKISIQDKSNSNVPLIEVIPSSRKEPAYYEKETQTHFILFVELPGVVS